MQSFQTLPASHPITHHFFLLSSSFTLPLRLYPRCSDVSIAHLSNPANELRNTPPTASSKCTPPLCFVATIPTLSCLLLPVSIPFILELLGCNMPDDLISALIHSAHSSSPNLVPCALSLCLKLDEAEDYQLLLRHPL